MYIGPINGNRRIIKKIIVVKPADSILYITSCSRSGANAYKSLDPSSGGNGIMLKTKNPRFTWIKIVMASYGTVPIAMPVRCIKMAAMAASAKLVSGPAMPMRAAPYSLKRTL
jgi:hypothetical protein